MQTIKMAEDKRRAKQSANKEEYNRLKAQIKTQIKKDKRTWLEKECEKIQEFDRCNNAKKLFEKIRSVKRSEFKPQYWPIKDKSGHTLTDPEHRGALERVCRRTFPT